MVRFAGFIRKRCRYCHDFFLTTKKNQVYCSKKCQQRNYRYNKFVNKNLTPKKKPWYFKRHHQLMAEIEKAEREKERLERLRWSNQERKTEEDIIIPDRLPEDLKDFLAWVKLPEIDFTTETMLVFILPLIVLVVYAVKKASEGPKRKWKYSYLK